jgi:hypothetical protein
MNMWSRIDRGSLLIMAALSAAACAEEPAEKTADAPVDTRAFDGKYNITFIRDGQFASIADFQMIDGVALGAVVGLGSKVFQTKGTLSSEGVLTTTGTADDGGQVEALGQVSTEGLVEGTYTVAGGEGVYFGFEYDDPDTLSTELDGEYRVSFELEGQDVASSTVTIKDGAFALATTSITGESFNVDGNVLADGHVILRSAVGDLGTGIASSAVIDGTSIRGVYYTNQGQRGTITGKPL